MRAVILAAGKGSRFRSGVPKVLLELPDGENILSRQVRLLRAAGLSDIVVVVGYRKELIEAHVADVEFVENADYATTNTARSLLLAVEGADDDVLWANGDLVYDEEVILNAVAATGNGVVVNRAVCGHEEVKYRLNGQGNITAIAKDVENSAGEALGINVVKNESLGSLAEALRACGDMDYFERAMEMMIERGAEFKPLDVSAYRCIEIDFEQDWQKALELFAR
ncbi:MAG TPA: phosphocholine cytidylyltransferase family protein [Acidobacteriota bacterium]|nr:phosphocholine cytidylyltransferase family protein [Acidobacteriota bacterium]